VKRDRTRRVFFRILQGKADNYWLTRYVFLRLIGLVYFVAFLTLVHQVLPLIGANGLLPAELYLERLGDRHDSRWDAFVATPSLFWLGLSDQLLLSLAWVGVALSFLVLVNGG